ncbi:carbohydrate esterase family 3 protein [Ophiostoma piceae UAMH 11346]|uniref:Carbohydrate esterase family 3 protein n=1 Tax=Ophiostoma piceae (strain UAMH 11346) TaxID=1262450 RepID=S3C6B6_OPHP1|nr:carbohydrate esterase family 3 protein [Ophiostoma piceae UAMH 11346]
MRFSLHAVVAAFAASAVAAPTVPLYVANGTEILTGPLDGTRHFARADAQDFYLRIMPFGASITYGLTSPDGNGYRKGLRQALRYLGWKVNMVGGVTSGNMNDNDNVGWPGFRVDQMMSQAEIQIPQWLPNVILINCGTNDAVQNTAIDTISGRMENLINYMWKTVPDAVIVLSSLLTQEPNPAGIESINKQYRALVSRLQRSGKKIVLAELDDGWIPLSELVDGIHPTESGYLKMASRFFQAINIANDLKWIKAPVETGIDDSAHTVDTKCYKTLGSAISDPRSPMQMLYARSPMIVDDGSYSHSSVSRGNITTGKLQKNQKVWWAQLVNAGGANRKGAVDELVYSEGGKFYMRVNGGGSFGPAVQLTTNVDCDADGTRFGDLNNDGLDDYLCLSPKGKLTAALNRGGNPPTFENVGVVHPEFSGDYTRLMVRLADIDGDGRIDYCLIKDYAMWCQRNGGNGETPSFWQDLGSSVPTFTDHNKRNLSGILLGDINGDFKADFMYMEEDGMIFTMINQRGAGKSLKPFWDDVGMTHPGMGEKSRDRVKLGRIYGSGRLDYTYFKCTKTDDDGTCHYELRVWENKGSGGTTQKGDGVFFCDMNDTGNDDYVFITKDGDISIFLNPNTPPATASASWDEHRNVLKTGVSRDNLQLGDWNADGRCDIISTDWSTGATYVWLTQYHASDNTFTFDAKKRVGDGASCTTGRGVGDYDIGVRYADIDGDRRVDYLCMELNGRTTGWLNKADGMESLGQVKRSENYDRANHRFADVNGDGLADFLWVDKFTGDATVWYNLGHKPDGGSNWGWYSQGKAYNGNARGTNMFWPNLGGLGRADMFNVEPKTGYGWVNFNTCGSTTGGSSNGDDGDIVDPGLPKPPDDGDKGAYNGGGNVPAEESNCGAVQFPSNADWLFGAPNIDCTADWVTDATCTAGGCNSQADRWNGGKCDDLVEWAVGEYVKFGGVDCAPIFAQWFSDKFHGPEGYTCASVLTDGCSAIIQCDDVQSAPGAYFVLNSITRLHSIFQQAWFGINALQTDVQGNMSSGVFMNVFNPKEDTRDIIGLKTIIDLTMFFAAGASAILWNKIIKDVAKTAKEIQEAAESAAAAAKQAADVATKAERKGLMQDTYMGAMAALFGIMRDRMVFANDQTGKAAQLNVLISIWFSEMEQTIVDSLATVISVTTDTKDVLPSALKDGKFMPNSNVDLDIQGFYDDALSMLYSVLIPFTWRLPQRNFHPFVLETNDACTQTDVDVSSLTKKMMSEKVAKKAMHCINDRAYYLVSATPRSECGQETNCDPDDLAKELPGANVATFESNLWGSIRYRDIVESVWRSWNQNEQKNGWKPYSDTSKVMQDPMKYFGAGPGAAFMWDIPFCEWDAFDDAYYNIGVPPDDFWDSYPCPPSRGDNKKYNVW